MALTNHFFFSLIRMEVNGQRSSDADEPPLTLPDAAGNPATPPAKAAPAPQALAAATPPIAAETPTPATAAAPLRQPPRWRPQRQLHLQNQWLRSTAGKGCSSP